MNKHLENLIETVTKREIQKFLEENKDTVIEPPPTQEEIQTETMAEWMVFESLLISKSPRYFHLFLQI